MTYEEVAKVCDQMFEEGKDFKDISIRKVRNVLGSGDKDQISTHIKRWKAENAARFEERKKAAISAVNADEPSSAKKTALDEFNADLKTAVEKLGKAWDVDAVSNWEAGRKEEEEKHGSFEAEYNEMENQLVTVEEANEKLQAEFEAYKTEAEAKFEAAKTEAEAKFNTAKAEAENQLNAAEAEANQLKGELKTKNEDLKKLEELKQKETELNLTLKQKDAEIANLNAALQKAANDLNQLKTEKDAEIAELKKDNKDLREKLEAAHKEKFEAFKDYSRIDDLKTIQEKMELINAEILRVHRDNERLKQQMNLSPKGVEESEADTGSLTNSSTESNADNDADLKQEEATKKGKNVAQAAKKA